MDLIPRKLYLDDLFDNFMLTRESDSMKCDIYEKGGKYHIEMDVPGFDKKDISLEVKNGYLNVTAHRKSEEDVKEKNYIRKERHYGSFTRSFYVGDKVEMNDIKASMDNGILSITVPKEESEEPEKKYIEIK